MRRACGHGNGEKELRETLETLGGTANQRDALLVRCSGSCSADGGATLPTNLSATSILDSGVYILQ